jgi:hypothetical protein
MIQVVQGWKKVQDVEAPCSKLQGIFEVHGNEEARFPSCSLTPQQAVGNALAMHFQTVQVVQVREG